MYLLHIATLLILGGTRERTATPLSAYHILVMIHHALCYIHTAVHIIEYMYVACIVLVEYSYLINTLKIL